MKRNYATMHVRKRIASILICVLLLGLVAICIGIPIRGVNAADTTYSDKIIALTFDDGPAEYTNRILDTLSENNCKATFFVIGRQINSHAQTLIRASSQGCEILGHSWDHEHLETLTANELRQNLQDTNNAIFNLLGTQPKMYRPPYGETGGNIISVSKEMDLAIIKWSVDPKDWEHKNADMTYDGIMNYVTNGSIILCHDIVSTTADAMEQIIPELVSRGYTLTTVSELLGKTEAGNIYTGSTEIPIPLYTVQPGDTLPLIAEKCGTTVYTIKILNNLTSDTIYPGQQLQLRYMIRLGDNLWLISKTYGTTVDDIKALNNLTSDTIYPGQQLQIPQPQPP
ncbi:MAG: polysaccharide deacetylase family protein, partial [Candidatus Bathyarchaeota archaeon]|nr:polysaccharide deacetylase family protein [Candidatus Termiticorpusculum sp.]